MERFIKQIPKRPGHGAVHELSAAEDGAVAGGVGSVLGGGKFANGAVTGAFGYLFNSALEQNDESEIMSIGEALRSAQIMDELYRYDDLIQAAAKSYGVDPNLVRAEIYEEQAHMWPLEGAAEPLGIGSTVGLGQVTVGYYGLSRYQLLDPRTNITAIAHLLSDIQKTGLIDPTRPYASVATRYNCGSCTRIDAYGRRVESYYEKFQAGTFKPAPYEQFNWREK